MNISSIQLQALTTATSVETSFSCIHQSILKLPSSGIQLVNEYARSVSSESQNKAGVKYCNDLTNLHKYVTDIAVLGTQASEIMCAKVLDKKVNVKKELKQHNDAFLMRVLENMDNKDKENFINLIQSTM